eukprot:8487405-Alexandrium_andersonii.AAC.1
MPRRVAGRDAAAPERARSRSTPRWQLRARPMAPLPANYIHTGQPGGALTMWRWVPRNLAPPETRARCFEMAAAQLWDRVRGRGLPAALPPAPILTKGDTSMKTRN